MLNIDCLFKNTALIDEIKKAVRYIAEEKASSDKDASFISVYNDMRKAGIEIDLSSAAHLYANELPLHDARFTSLKDLQELSGKSFESTARNLILQKPKDTEQEIGKLSPSQAAAKHIVDAFSSTLIEDNTTKSIMRQLQDAMIKGSERLLGEKPEDVNEKKPKTAEEIIQGAIDLESKGFRDIDGNLNGIKKVFDATREEIKRYTDELSAKGDEHTAELWDSYINSFEDATYSLLFSKAEGKQVLKEGLLKEYGKDTKSGRVIDWGKLAGGINDITTLKDNVKNAFSDKFGEDVAQKIANSLGKEYVDLRGEVLAHAEKQLAAKEKQLDREAYTPKSELTRLAELHDLGAFNGAHDKLLAHVLGVEEHDRQAIEDVRQYAEQLSRLRQLMNGNSFIVPSMERKVAQSINEIIANTIENKTKLLKTVSFVNKVFQVENSGLVSGYRNLLENHLSGLYEFITTKANVSSKLGGELKGFKGDLVKDMWDTWRNIAVGGKEFGEAPYQVENTQVRVTDKYNIRQMKGADWSKPETYLKGVASAAMTVPRAFLSGTDGAIKTGLYRLHFLSSMHDALVNSGKYTSEQAVTFINDAMYGEGALARAREKAKDLYDQSGISYVSQKEINITANELLHENLLREKEITPEILHEVQKSAFRQAGLGMGHESNNPVSKMIQSSKLKFQREELKAFNDGNYDRAASMKAWNTGINSVLLRFMASQFNWAWLKIEQSGVGLVSGLYHYHKGKRIEVRGLENMTEAQRMKMAEEYQLGRQKLFRGALGLAANAATTFILMPAIAKALNPNEEDPVKKMFADMGDNYLAKALFLKLSPIWGLGQYFYHQMDANESGSPVDKSLAATGETIQNVFGYGNNTSSAVKFAEMSKLLAQGAKTGNEKVMGKGETELGQLLGNYLPHVPFYKQGKDVLQTVDYFATGKEPMYKYPYGFMSGLLGGGVLQDMNMLPPNPLISLPYVGKKQMETFKYYGIETMKDIKDQYGEGADAFIENVVGHGEKGKKAVKAYHAEVGE